MLSNSLIGNSSQASHYFLGQDNYYTKDDEIAKVRSAWWGKGALALNLEGQVDAKVFNELLEGKMPTGEQLGLKVGDEIKHRPGFDLTFSVPKSVSIAALLGNDARILEAVQRATDKALSLVERSCAQSRITKAGETVYENTKNLVVAKFLHDLSREADPQLHVHCVVMNMTERSDGKWRSLASQLGDYGTEVTRNIQGFIERVRHHEHYFGHAFNAELAFELKNLGYNIIKPDYPQKSVSFEIEGISQQSIDLYSRRRRQIDAYMKDYGYSGAKAAAVATLKTRQSKQNIQRETVDTLWQQMSKLKEIDAFGEARRCVEKARDQPTAQLPASQNLAEVNQDLYHVGQRAVRYAVQYLAETQIVLKETAIANAALTYGLGENVTLNAIFNAIEKFKNTGELIALESAQGRRENDRAFITPLQLEHEQAMLRLVQAVGNAPLLPVQKIAAYLNVAELNPEQRQAIRTLFSHSHPLSILDGSAGTGKTHLIKTMITLAKAGGYQTVCLTPGKGQNEALKASLTKNPTLKEWVRSLFIKDCYTTVSGFLKAPDRYMGNIMKKKTLAFIDDAQLISSKQWYDLSVMAQKSDIRLIALGDQKSLQTFQAGSPYTQMLKQGAVFASLTQNYRTQAKDLKEAVADSLHHYIDKAFEKIKDRIFTVEEKESRLSMMAQRYAALSQQEREHTLLLMPSQSQCEALNLIVREALKKYEILQTAGIFMETLMPKHFPQAAYQSAKHYAKGQWIRFNEDYRSLKVQKGDYLKVLDIRLKQNTLLLENEKGQQVLWNPLNAGGRSGHIEVFESKMRELAVGETLHWRRNDRKLGVYNGERLRLVKVSSDQLTLQRDNQKAVKISLGAMSSRHFDYGYVLTPYRQSPKNPRHIIAYQSSVLRQTHQRLFYKTLGQAKENVWIYTEDKTALLKNIQRCTGDKITALEALLGKDKLEAVTEIRLLEKIVLEALSGIKDLSKGLKETTPQEYAKDAVYYAIAHLAEREAAFEHKEVMKVALQYALGKSNVEMLAKAIETAEKNGDLLKGMYSQEGTRWTTLETLDMEREVLKLASQDKTLVALCSVEKIEAYLKSVNPKAEHDKAMRDMLSHTRPVLNIEGHAGVGKTTLLKHIEPLLIQEKFELLCLAPTHGAVKELRARGLKAQTLESFLGQHRVFCASLNSLEKEAVVTKTIEKRPELILAVDESSMVSNRRMRDFLRIADALEARSWIMGDPKQYPAIESGKPAALLARAGVKTLYLTDIERQKEPTLLAAVKSSYQEDFTKAFRLLEKHMIEIGNEVIEASSQEPKTAEKIVDNWEIRLKAVAKAYVELDPKERAQTLMITFGNKDRTLANGWVREVLLQQGELSGPEITTKILASKDMTAVEKSRANNYQIGDKLRFGESYQKLDIEKHTYLTVKGIDPRRNLLELSTPKGEDIAFKLEAKRTFIEAYQTEERALQAGDYIRWTRSDKDAGFLSPEVLRVEKVTPEKVVLQPVSASVEGWQARGDLLSIETQNCRHQHWDYAYVSTSYSAQGRTVKNILLNAESYRKKLTNQASFLVGLTRAVEKVTIYTDDKKKLLQKIKSTAIEKTSALEITGELSPLAKKEIAKFTVKEFSHTENPRAEEERSWKKFLFKQKAVEKQAQRAEKQIIKAQTPLEKAQSIKERDLAVKQRFVDMQTQERQKTAEKAQPAIKVQTSLVKNQSVKERLLVEKPLSKQTFVESTPKKPILRRLDTERITQALHENITMIVEDLLGKPKNKTAQQYRYGSNQGSLVVTLKGQKKGFWHDFQTGEGGNLLHLIARETGFNIKTDFQKVLEEAAKLLGSSEALFDEPFQKRKVARLSPIASKSELTDAQKKSLQYAKKLATESKPIKGTLAEKYLKRHRAIVLDTFPDSIRYHPAIYSRLNEGIYPALLAVAKDEKGKVSAVQAIYLDEATAKRAEVSVKKQTWGLPSAGGAVHLGEQNLKESPVFLAEGVETGLSLLMAMKNASVKVTLGKSNFKNIRLPKEQKDIVLCLDNDGKPQAEKEMLANIIEKLKNEERTLWAAMPTQANKDYNDILKEEGLQAVKQNIEKAVRANDFIHNNIHTQTLKTERLNKPIFLSESYSTETRELKNELIQSISKVAAQVNYQEAALSQIHDNSCTRNKDFVQKDKIKTLPAGHEIKMPENKKITETVREIDKEIEL